MDMKPIRVADTALENGKLSPVSHAADAGEKVVIKAEPEEGYRVKQGSMKAEILMGTESKQIVLKRGEDGNYSFTMPANATKVTSRPINWIKSAKDACQEHLFSKRTWILSKKQETP